MNHDAGGDHLYRTLDGCAITVLDRWWRIRLYRVRLEDDQCWIHLALLGTPTYMLALRLPPAAGAAEAMAMLTAWLTAPGDSHHSVVNTGRLHLDRAAARSHRDAEQDR